MSEPTTEQIEKALTWLWANKFGAPNYTKGAAAYALQETAPLHEKIASLEKQLAGALQLSETHRKAWQAALAPPAQTQQGLSEEEVEAIRAAVTAEWINALDGACSRCLRGAAWGFPEDAPNCLECGTALRDLCSAPAPLNLEKQPSPAAAPAQLSEVLRDAHAALRMVDDAYWGEFCGCCCVILSLDAADEECGPAHTAVHLAHEWLEAHPDPAALAGQPAPTDDQKALRAALRIALRTRSDFKRTWNANGGEEGSPSYLMDVPSDELQRQAWRYAGSGGSDAAEHIAREILKLLHPLAGSPAQQGQLGKKVAK